MAKATNRSDEELAEIQRKLEERHAQKIAKEEARRSWWAKYYEQLAKMTPNQGGATHKNRRRIIPVKKLM